MKLLLRLISLILTLTLAACASTGTKTKVLSSASVTNASIPIESVMHGPTLSEELCPLNDKAWRKERFEKLNLFASACAQHKKHDRLEALANFISQKFHKSPLGPFYMSVSAEQSGDWQLALWMIDLALKRDTEQALLHYQKARVLWGLKNYALAIQSFEKASQLNERFVEPMLFLAQIYFRDLNYKKADQYFTRVLELEASHIEALTGLAESKVQARQYKVASSLYEKAISASPRSFYLQVRLANIYELNLKDDVAALSIYKRISNLMKNSAVKKEEMTFDVDDKIKQIESRLAQNESGDRQISTSDKNSKQVRK